MWLQFSPLAGDAIMFKKISSSVHVKKCIYIIRQVFLTRGKYMRAMMSFHIDMSIVGQTSIKDCALANAAINHLLSYLPSCTNMYYFEERKCHRK